ncbi:MAG TPA: hypothetical protein VIG33_14825 [Pseudobdellovibrionaceae bacterium]|jgi:hypothetical protein
MTWLINLLVPVIEWILNLGIKQLMAWWKERKDKEDVQKKKSAELEQSKKDLQKDLKGAGDDEKAQEDAIDNFFKRTR